MMNVKKKIGRKIRLFRKRKGLTQEKFAEIMDVSITYLGLIERGEVLPSLNKCVKIAEFFNVPLYKIFVEEDEEDKDDYINEIISYLKEVEENNLEFICNMVENIATLRNNLKRK